MSWLSLPVDIVRHSVLSFLSLKLLVQLDSAVCETVSRAHLMAIMTHYRLPQHHYTKGLDCYTWVHMRRMRLSWFYLQDNVDIEQLLPLRPIFESLRDLSVFYPLPDKNYLEFVGMLAPCSLHELCISHDDNSSWNEGLLQSFLAKQNSLRYVELLSSNITNQLLLCIAQNCPLIESFSVESGDCTFEEAIIKQLFSACRKVRKIYWLGAAVNDTMLERIGVYSKKLETLCVESHCLTNKGLLSVVEGCPKLTSLSVELTAELTATGLALCSAHLTQLRELTVNNSILREDILHLFKNCTSLTAFSGKLQCEVVVLAAPLWTNISSLYLTSSDLDNSALLAIALHCRKIQKLTLCGNPRITDVALIALSQNSPNLEDFTLGDCELVADEGVIAVVQDCSKLRHFIIFRNPLVTSRSAEAVARRMYPRKNCLFFGCDYVTNYDVYNAWLKVQHERR